MLDVITRFNPVVIAVGEGGEWQLVGRGGFGHSAEGGDAGGEGDMGSQANEALGELEAGIYMALHWICNEKEAAAHHDRRGTTLCN